MKTDTFFVISRYKENVDWIDELLTNYVIYNKSGERLDHKNVIDVPNVGGNQVDIFRYIYYNYDNLPNLIGFVQANPFDHAPREVFEKLIQNKWLTCLEHYPHNVENDLYKKSPVDRLYMERNVPWWLCHDATSGMKCKYSSLDEFMHLYFKNYEHLDYIRFSPGSQYIVEKERILKYSIEFWKSLMEELPKNNMTEAHLIERILFLLFSCVYEARF